MINEPVASIRGLLAGFLASGLLLSSALPQTAQAAEPAGQVHATVSSPAGSAILTSASPPSTSRTVTSERAAMMYRKLWGVDDIRLQETASGSMIRFSYKVVDANRAKILNDKRATPTLTDEATGTKLQVPVMEKVGQLRQTPTPENGREYWMVFSNKSHIVKAGSRVTVVIDKFRAEGLVVEGNELPRAR
jgi:hypothetical protein